MNDSLKDVRVNIFGEWLNTQIILTKNNYLQEERNCNKPCD